jgi:hypothetical protein
MARYTPLTHLSCSKTTTVSLKPKSCALPTPCCPSILLVEQGALLFCNAVSGWTSRKFQCYSHCILASKMPRRAGSLVLPGSLMATSVCLRWGSTSISNAAPACLWSAALSCHWPAGRGLSLGGLGALDSATNGAKPWPQHQPSILRRQPKRS